MLYYEQFAAFSNESKRADEPLELDENTCGPFSEKEDQYIEVNSVQLNKDNPSFALLGHSRKNAPSPAPSDIYSEAN